MTTAALDTKDTKSDLEQEIDRNIAYLQDRTADWGALEFQAKIDPKYRRAQMRYIGQGGVDAKGATNMLKAEHFTLSTMILPAGCEGPLHLHDDVEEVFFVLDGNITFFWEKDGQTVERTIGPRDLIFTPAGMWRGLRNDGDTDGLMLVMLGAAKPVLPSYPEGSPLTEARSHK